MCEETKAITQMPTEIKDQTDAEAGNKPKTTKGGSKRAHPARLKKKQRQLKKALLQQRQNTTTDEESSVASYSSSNASSVSSPTRKKSGNNKPIAGKKRNRKLRSKALSISSQTEDNMEESLIMSEEHSRYVALDCEMVETSTCRSALARVSIVNYFGNVILDTHVKVEDEVTDYRTSVSGVTAEDLNSGAAMDYDQCIELVSVILEDKILIGHGLKNDLRVLDLTHPWYKIRDTTKYTPFLKSSGADGAVLLPRKLKELAKYKLSKDIQMEGHSHCSLEDARASLDLYKSVSSKWEKMILYKVNKTKEIEQRLCGPSN